MPLLITSIPKNRAIPADTGVTNIRRGKATVSFRKLSGRANARNPIGKAVLRATFHPQISQTLLQRNRMNATAEIRGVCPRTPTQCSSRARATSGTASIDDRFGNAARSFLRNQRRPIITIGAIGPCRSSSNSRYRRARYVKIDRP